MRRWVVALLGLVLLAIISGQLAYAASPAAQSAADFYKNNTVTLICNYEPGGGVDFVDRVFAGAWQELGLGSMLVRNMPGGNANIGANFVYASKPNGTTIGITELFAVLVFPPLLKDAAAQFDPLKLSYIGMIEPVGNALAVGKDSPYKSVKDLQKAKGLKFGSTWAKGIATSQAALAFHLLNVDAKIISGFKGTTEMGLSTARGEIDGYVTGEPIILDHIDKGQAKPPLLIIDIQRSQIFPDTPCVKDLLTFPVLLYQYQLSPENERSVKYAGSLKSAKGIFGPPDIPQDRLQYLRTAFDKISANQPTIEQLKRRLQFWTPPVNDKEVTSLVKSAMTINPTEID